MTRSRFGTLGITAALILGIAVIPLVFVVHNSLQLGTPQWAALWTTRLPTLATNTLLLAVLVAAACFVLGISTAWWVARRRFAGRSIAMWLMILPLSVPTYVLAHVYTSLFEHQGALERVWQALFGAGNTLPDLHNLGGATLVLALAGFSYVFLLAYAALSYPTRTLEEAARIQGASRWQVFWRINLPLLRPAIAAGLAVVVLHVVSDFGAVSMLRYQTFTLAIYLQMSGRFDYQAAAGLSLVLVLLSLTFLVLERFFRKQQRYYTSRQPRQGEIRQATQTETLLIWLWIGLIALLAFGVPLAWMLSWSWNAILLGAIDAQFWGYVRNSLLVAALAASIAMVAAFPIAFFNTRARSTLSGGFIHLSSIGFVLPGPVIALGILTFVLAQLPLLYGTLVALVLAVVIRFLPLAVQSQDAALQQLTPSIEQAGRILGARPLENLWRVVLPMVRGGMATAWVLVFIDTLKELPATLLLRPTGFDTLPVRIWIEASEDMLELAAPAALVLVLSTLPAIVVIMRGQRRY